MRLFSKHLTLHAANKYKDTIMISVFDRPENIGGGGKGGKQHMLIKCNFSFSHEVIIGFPFQDFQTS